MKTYCKNQIEFVIWSLLQCRRFI